MMKTLLVAFLLIVANSASAQCSSPVRAAYNVYRAQGAARDLLSCSKQSCIQKSVKKIETNLCAAIGRCTELGERIELQCIDSRTLTPESREKIETAAKEAVKDLMDEAVEMLRRIRDSLLGRNNSEETDVDTEEVPTAEET